MLLQTLFLQGQYIPDFTPEIKQQLADRMYGHVSALAHDSMMGREAGTDGELKAMYYIASQFKNAGLQPLPDKNYWIPFNFSEGYTYKSGKISIDGKSYDQNEYFLYLNPLVNYNFSGNIFFAGHGLKDSDFNKLNPSFNKNIVIVIDINYTDTCADAANQQYMPLLESAVAKATSMNPEAVILVSSNVKKFPAIAGINLDKASPNIPVLCVGKTLSKKILKKNNSELHSECEFSKNEKTGYNVAAWIDNGKPTTLVFGAHYDHVGFGSSGSLSTDSAIHNGADDNASGTALLMELSRILYNSGTNKHNYVFVAFSAEEKGLLGSKAFLNQRIIADTSIIAMLNFDMVGRMNGTEQKLNILGTGTATEWDSLITAAYAGPVTIRKSESGTAGSDQMSFYLRNIPVLFFITGMHEDYHKPTDDAEKINRAGMADVLMIALKITEELDGLQKLNFVRGDTRGGDRNKRPGVTLGVIPDHAWEGKGMRIDAVTKDKTADKAGLLKGDIVIQIDDMTVIDIMSYMKALSAFKKGDKAKITYLRGQIENTVEVVF
ncbi:MAG: hypothetical protein A2W93_12610 [Bacteroidetes bacterium GWF2_43_63]|nr:MAG: hypothetical protein A2W94_14730 [Bacteroidetes bacterium GWE2_42_42]OFY54202.1 MAG: hypothetical protein A2W93_12610 [Bacteroidetes bacterium GWF2_43_63]